MFNVCLPFDSCLSFFHFLCYNFYFLNRYLTEKCLCPSFLGVTNTYHSTERREKHVEITVLHLHTCETFLIEGTMSLSHMGCQNQESLHTLLRMSQHLQRIILNYWRSLTEKHIQKIKYHYSHRFVWFVQTLFQIWGKKLWSNVLDFSFEDSVLDLWRWG